ncbi:DEAD-box ATP-dependent RNA helicase 35-like [Apium graveolens]|uniref:DEAD-box ATP-dependent RNA helicase 35-like n=1 Tax=Apium graveolens TaxID=4045 RepID=UPI003D7A7CBD
MEDINESLLVAQSLQYNEPVPAGWKPPLAIRNLSRKDCETIRKKHRILVEGEDIPPPISNFEDMQIPEPVLRKLAEKGIVQPTPVQVQALPVILSGRDMIGMASTGSGKTLAFVLPMIMMAIQEEHMMPFVGREGPLGLVVCPSRELAKQIYDVVEEIVECMREYDDYPVIRSMLCIGGVDMRSQLEILKRSVHIVVATPGRLSDMLGKNLMNPDNCRYLVLDEADRMMDSGFEDHMRELIDCFRDQRQTILFSATMPKKIRDFARSALVKPVTVIVGEAGAASLNVIQEVEYVKQEEKFLCLLQGLEKTPSPVLVLSESQAEVDKIHEYLISKGVEAVSVHGGKDNEERQHAISCFKAGKKDVLVATDVVLTSFDFHNIQHVINFDMPEQIENYIHRIGRCGEAEIATTFITSRQSEAILRALKHVLIEAKQKVPPVLAELSDVTEAAAFGNANQFKVCANCGELSHCIQNCPKLEHQNIQVGGYRYEGQFWDRRL